MLTVRIARTELHRAYTDQQSRELTSQDRIEYVQLRLSSKYPKPDICDYHAKVNLYGLGAGIYPKADAPKLPFHPHCFCLLSPRVEEGRFYLYAMFDFSRTEESRPMWHGDGS